MKDELRYSKIEDKPNLIKDHISNAIINTNIEGWQAAQLRKKRFKESKKVKEEMQDLRLKIIKLEELLKQKI